MKRTIVALLLCLAMAVPVFAGRLDAGIYAANKNPIIGDVEKYDYENIGLYGHYGAGIFDFGMLVNPLVTGEGGFFGKDAKGFTALPMAGFGWTFAREVRINAMAGIGFGVYGGDVVSSTLLKTFIAHSPVYYQAGVTWYPKGGSLPFYLGAFLLGRSEKNIQYMHDCGFEIKDLLPSSDAVFGFTAGISL